MINLGDKVRDRITGLTGIAIGRTEWLFGCVRMIVQPQELREGKPIDAVSIDEPQLDLVEAAKPAPAPAASGPHGPRPDPVRSPAVPQRRP